MSAGICQPPIDNYLDKLTQMQSCNEKGFHSVKVKKRIPYKNMKSSSQRIKHLQFHQSQYHNMLLLFIKLTSHRIKQVPRRYPITHTSYTAVTTALTTAASTRTDVVATTTRIKRIKIEKIPNSPGSHPRLKLLKIFSSGIPLKYLNITAIVTDIVMLE